MRLSVIRSDVYYQLRMLLRSKGTLFWILFFPVMLMFLFGLIFSNADEMHVTMHVLDLDDSETSRGLVDNLSAMDFLTLETIPEDVDAEDVQTYINDNDVTAALVIPDGFADAVLINMAYYMDSPEEFNATFGAISPTDAASGKVPPFLTNFTAFKSLGAQGPVNTTLTLYMDESQQSVTGVVRGVVGGFTQGMNMQILFATETIYLEEDSSSPEGFDFIDFFMPGVIGLSLMQNAIYGAILRNTKYREMGLLRKFSTTPLKRTEYIMSKMAYTVIMGFVSTGVIIAIGVLAFGVNVHINLWAFLMIVAVSFAFSGLGMIISAYVKEEETADSAAGAITFPMMFLAGTFFPLEMMPSFLSIVARFLPLFYVNEGLRAAMIYNDATGALYNTGIVVVLAIVFFGIGSMVTTWKED